MSKWAQGTVVVVGAGGMLARDLIPRLKERASREGGNVLAWTRNELDITQRESVLSQMKRAAPTLVINCAAYTDVDGCESNAAKAMTVNGEGPGYLAEACKAAGAKLVHYSTDFVFDGESRRPYGVDDRTNPLSVYGKSKLEGERTIASHRCRSLIIRTSWLYGPHGRNFVETILGRAQKGEPLNVVNDQTGRPTHTVDLCDATLRLLDAQAKGMVHFANTGQCSWHEFAVEIVRQAGLSVSVATLSSSELGRPARRPAFSVLDLTSYEQTIGATPRHWKEALGEYLRSRRMGGKAA